MPSIFGQLGVRTIINAAGPVTRLSGARMSDEVLDAMREAGQFCVDIAEMQAVAGALIAEVTGAESGYVTSGAAAGLVLATAACVTGLDPGKMNRLPDTTGMKSEVIMPRSHRNFYDHAVRSVGVTLIEVGIPDRFSGAGVRDTEAWEIGDAINERTAAIVYVAQSHAQPPLPEVSAVAKEHGVPVIVDAAGQLPPAANLKRFINEGADAVCFSGGKAMGGPQGSGVLCGRRDLISAAALQHLDLDVHFELWQPPPSLIDKSAMPGAPQHGIGRPCKAGKEQIAGLMVALKRFVAEGDEVRHTRWSQIIHDLAEEIGTLPGAEISVDVHRTIPVLRLVLSQSDGGIDLVKQLMDGEPSVHVSTSGVYDGILAFNPICLTTEDIVPIAVRLKESLG
jgi:D-glucosaminate-6-phosphate ammonia-lyase